MGYKEDVKTEKGQGLERFAGVEFLLPGNDRYIVEGLSGEKGVTVFRIYPEIDANGVELPLRNSPNPDDFTYWMRPEKAMRRCGVNQHFSVFVRPYGKEHNYVGPIERFSNTLYKVFKDNANAAVFPPAYRSWTGRGGALPRIEYLGLVQGMLFESRGRKYAKGAQATPLHPTILLVNKSARNALERIVNDDHTLDLVSTQGGRAVFLQYVPQQGTTLSHYEVSPSHVPTAVDLETVRADWKPWEELLKFHTEEEQMGLLINHFPPDILDYVFGTSPMAALLPPSARGAWARRMHMAAAAQQPQPGHYSEPVYADGSAPTVGHWAQAPMAPAAPVVSTPAPQAPGSYTPAPAAPVVSAPAPVVMRQPQAPVMQSPAPAPQAPVAVQMPQAPGGMQMPMPAPQAPVGMQAPMAAPQAPVSVSSPPYPVISQMPQAPDGTRGYTHIGVDLGVPVGDPVVDNAVKGSIRERLQAVKQQTIEKA